VGEEQVDLLFRAHQDRHQPIGDQRAGQVAAQERDAQVSCRLCRIDRCRENE
jgi:hypothetical protein